MSRRTVFSLAFGIALLGCANAAIAADYGPLHDKFSVSLGTYFMSSDTRIRLDSVRDVDVGTAFDLENTFGFDDDTVFRLEGAWRFARRHKLRLMYFESSRTARDSIDEEIQFGDTTFPVNVLVTAKFDFDIIELAYEYEFLRRENYELGASIGIHNVGFNTRLGATVSSSGQSGSVSLSEDAEVDAPLPVIGLRGSWHMGGNFYLQAHAQYFQLKFGDYKGSIEDYHAGVLWQFTRHFGVGVAYNLFDTDVDVDDGEKFRGTVDWKYDGAQLFIRAAF